MTGLPAPLALQISTGPDKHRPRDEEGRKLEVMAEGSTARAEGDLLVLAVGNGKQAGGGIPLCPDAGVRLSCAGAGARRSVGLKGCGIGSGCQCTCTHACPSLQSWLRGAQSVPHPTTWLISRAAGLPAPPLQCLATGLLPRSIEE